MESIDWHAEHQRAVRKAKQAQNGRAKAAYLDLAEFYARRLQRMHTACPGTVPQSSGWAGAGGLTS